MDMAAKSPLLDQTAAAALAPLKTERYTEPAKKGDCRNFKIARFSSSHNRRGMNQLSIADREWHERTPNTECVQRTRPSQKPRDRAG